jgi:hypothetical protein
VENAKTMQLHTEIEITAPADIVWRVLSELAAYPDWNPFLVRVDGELATGARLEVTFAPPGGKPMTMRPTVLRVEPGRGFAWLGRLAGVPKLFDGEHSFAIEPIDGGRVRFVHSEEFGGILVPFLRKMLDTSTRAGFEALNAALKDRAEAIAAGEATATGRTR